MSEQPTLRRHLHRETLRGGYPDACAAVLSPRMMEEARAEIATWPGYAPTPLRRLDALQKALGLSALWYKDEGARFGLDSFKALGGSYAVLELAARTVEQTTGARPPMAEIRAGTHARALKDLTVVSATDGNHGRSVAWGAQMAGARCRIYIHRHVSAGREAALAALGAEVIRVEGDYDQSVRQCAQEASENGWSIVSDTSYEGYKDLPRFVMAGYTVMAAEAIERLREEGVGAPTHLVVQAGVGGVAAAMAARFWAGFGPARPHLIVVEPDRAACLIASAEQDAPASVAIAEETVMAGLSCGETSHLAWDILSRGADDFVVIGEEGVPAMMKMLAEGRAGGGAIAAGESAVPGLLALIALARAPEAAAACGLGPTSRVLCFGCEGATDRAIYEAMLADPAAEADLLAGVEAFA
ncbi:MAG: diaminopropionate ammonia-lyase [Marivibrio sp.]|uniref:diaminopropionate ammonia-lyase n=1 Tax=Marivibrio sp. TaxID=2039719 RepID=UPI0032EBC6F2